MYFFLSFLYSLSSISLFSSIFSTIISSSVTIAISLFSLFSFIISSLSVSIPISFFSIFFFFLLLFLSSYLSLSYLSPSYLFLSLYDLFFYDINLHIHNNIPSTILGSISLSRFLLWKNLASLSLSLLLSFPLLLSSFCSSSLFSPSSLPLSSPSLLFILSKSLFYLSLLLFHFPLFSALLYLSILQIYLRAPILVPYLLLCSYSNGLYAQIFRTQNTFSL